jgi:DNA-binding response OmpR family regulator
MPDLRGDTVFRAARALRADLPVILVTGYDAAQTAAGFEGLAGYLRKPWEPEALVAAVQAARTRSH